MEEFDDAFVADQQAALEEAVVPVMEGFYGHEATACLKELQARMAKFGLKLHGTKTRLIEFGRFAAENRERRGKRPETFDFLGFTHVCSRTRRTDQFTVHRYSVRKRMRATLGALRIELRRRMHDPVGKTGRWLNRVVTGWLNYHAVPNNQKRTDCFRHNVLRLWLHVLRRRSQRGQHRWTWQRFLRLATRYLPPFHVRHPYPHQRFYARLKAGAV